MPLFMDVHERIDGLTADAACAVHKEAHGLVADSVTEVTEGA